LANEDYKSYAKLIKAALDDNFPIDAKFNLYCLLMNHGTEKLCVENLTTQLRNLYCSDENIEKYVHEAVFYNPKLGYVSISSKSRRDINHDYSADISIRCSEENADRTLKRVKEVLTMMLLESKTVCP
jgi:uncharacterized linocin/CFP29 family protein